MLADVVRLCEFGPRPSGSAAAAAQRAWLADRFGEHGGVLAEQPFTAEDPRSGRIVPMVNLIASWGAPGGARLLVGAHGDTRPFPDRERDPARRRFPFLGANDGGSGLAVLLELARLLGAGAVPPTVGVDLVVFDGEELVYGRRGEYCLGSREFARRYHNRKRSDPTYRAGIVVDMVGMAGLTIDRELHGECFARDLTDAVWETARRLGAGAFRDRDGRAIIDDHLPLLEVGIPTVVLIDLDDPRWHTADDLPAHCSADSLGQVAGVVLAWLAAGGPGGDPPGQFR